MDGKHKRSPGREAGHTWELESYMNEAGTIKYPLSLSREQDEAIKRAAKHSGRSRADIIRTALEQYLPDEFGIEFIDNLKPGGLRPGGFGRDEQATSR